MSGEGRWTGVGNIGSDPELKFLDSGRAVCSFSIANTPRVKDRDGNWADGETMWIRITCWGTLAEGAAEFLTKGSKVFVSGPMKQTTFQTKNGESRVGLEVTADDLNLGEVQLIKKAKASSGGDDPGW